MRALRGAITGILAISVGCGPTTTTMPPAASEEAPTGVASPSIDPMSVGSSGGIDPLYPALGNGGYDVGRYEIAIATDPATNETTIVSRIEATATQTLTTFTLDYAGIPVGSIDVDGAPAAFAHVDGKLAITPARRIDDGRAFEVSVEIAGRPTAVRGAGWTWHEGEQVSAYGLYDAVPTWLPVNADPADKAIVEFRVAVPEPFVAVAPGVLLETIERDGEREFHWRAGPTSSFTLTIREYEVVDRGIIAGIPVVSYEPADLPDRQRASIDVLPRLLESLVAWYGPYPFEGLNLVWVTDRTDRRGPDEGLLHWGPDRRDAGDLAHHLTQIWFQVNATPRTAQESWLRAAFANYADLLWIEVERGTEARDGIIGLWYTRLGERTDAPANPSRAAENEALFSRGPLSLHALRRIVGDETFFDILRAWVVRYHRASATVGDFVALAEQVSGRSLDDWEQAWLRSEPVPPRTDLGLSSG
jgi:aminopeptidase N